MATIRFNQLRFSALARIVMICQACIVVPLGALICLNSLLGGTMVKVDRLPVTGVKGVLVGVVLTGVGFVLMLVPALFGAAIARLVSRSWSGPMLQVSEAPVPSPRPSAPPYPHEIEDQEIGL